MDFDLMMHTANCKTLHKYLSHDKYDMERLHQMVYDHFGRPMIDEIETLLEQYYEKDITTLKQYFNLIDAKVAEMYQTEHADLRKFQRQECFILSNNFIGPDPVHANIFVSRILVPMMQVMENARQLHSVGKRAEPRYLITNFHDTNLSNLLRFI